MRYGHGVGRLDDIAKRNVHPWRMKNMLSFGIRSLFLLLILALLIFTSWAKSPPDDRPGVNVIAPPTAPKKPSGVYLYREPAKK